MKITSLIMLISVMAVSASTYAQKINLSEKRANLGDVLEKLRQQSGYDFIYSDNLVKDKAVTVSLTDASLDEALKAVLANQAITYDIEENTVVFKEKSRSLLETLKGYLALIDVSGKVVDEKGLPLPGVTVTVKPEKGTSNTGNTITITNQKGEFSLKKVNENAVLVLTFIGYQKKEIAVNSDLSNVRMEPSDSKLDEVQVQAYGKTSLRLSTGDITTIKAADVEKQSINNPLLALQGRVSGLTVTQSTGLPGGKVNVQIRGRNSLNGSDPLFIVDGLPYDNTISGLMGPYPNKGDGTINTELSAFNFINPNDIESISVLKDADATAIYGSRGANGVILITTKKGIAGPAKLDVNVQSGIGKINQRLRLMNTKQYLSMRKEAILNDGGTINNPPEIYDPVGNSDVYLYDSTRYTNWQDKFLGGTAHYNNINASISGGGTNIGYIIGGTYHKETTVFPGQSDDQKANVHFSINGSSLNQKLKASLTGSYMSNWTNFARQDFTRFIFLPPNAPDPYLPDGSLNWGLYTIQAWNFTSSTFNNPYAVLFQPYKAQTNNLTASGDIGYQITSSLNIKATLGYNNLSSHSIVEDSPFKSIRPDLQPFTLRESDFNQNDIQSIIIEPQITFSPKVGNGLLDVLLGATYQSKTATYENIHAYDFPNDQLMNSLAAASRYTGSNPTSQYKYNAIFGRISYNLKDRYLLNANLRRDGSSRFGPGKQFGNFVSLGAAWVFSEESIIKDKISILSFGKLRINYGTSGNDGIPDYGYFERYNPTFSTYQDQKGYLTSGVFNLNYGWESTTKAELGIDASFFHDRLLLSFNFYRNRSSNQLVNYPLPSISGPGNYTINLPAVVQNSGFESSVSAKIIDKAFLRWTMSGNISINRNKLVEYPNLASSSYYLDYAIGSPIGMVKAYDFAGVDPATGQYQFRDKDGKFTFDPSQDPQNKTQFIDLQPRFYGGLQNSFTYQNLTFDFLFQFVKQKGRNYLYDFSNTPGYIGINQPIELLNRWKSPAELGKYQRYNQDISLSDAYTFASQSTAAYTDASFIRLKTVTLSYSLPIALKSNLGVNDLKINVSGQNLWTITGYKSLDPETQSVSTLPTMAIITIGLKATF
ncbi:SusC/RagA family TonB-linked outer membrane protein [Mucilaginibacter sp. CAU 1740]|uniref:SusC/RagA family TonB-linked outer membrane protein n=1 Tax=Mucilaginibacter sp. CAU 1740 TaxID=3140365 RepID=UPI00325A8C0E